MDYGTAYEAAYSALELWPGTCQGLVIPVGKSASSVFGVRVDGATHFLRLTNQSFRKLDDATDEVAFLSHLHAHGVRVAMPVASIRGRNVEEVGGYRAVMFRRAPGFRVTAKGPYWDQAFFRAWGRALALQHEAARSFDHPSLGWRRDWRREPVLVDGLAKIRATDQQLAQAAETILATLEAQASVLGEVATAHNDMAPQNFRYKPGDGITAFDFDNCCRHWLLHDIAVSLSVLRLWPERGQLVQWLFEGYRDVRPFPGDPVSIRLLLRLRLLYVYCDRLYSFGAAPVPEQANILNAFRDRLIGDNVW